MNTQLNTDYLDMLSSVAKVQIEDIRLVNANTQLMLGNSYYLTRVGVDMLIDELKAIKKLMPKPTKEIK